MIMDEIRLAGARYEYQVQIACLQSGLGGNPIVGMIEKGYTEEARYVAEEFRKHHSLSE
jgi:hypothetical protein